MHCVDDNNDVLKIIPEYSDKSYLNNLCCMDLRLNQILLLGMFFLNVCKMRRWTIEAASLDIRKSSKLGGNLSKKNPLCTQKYLENAEQS